MNEICADHRDHCLPQLYFTRTLDDKIGESTGKEISVKCFCALYYRYVSRRALVMIYGAIHRKYTE